MKKYLNQTFGFSLIELLIVIALIGVLATVLIMALNPNTQIKRARDAQRKSDVRQIQSGLEMYRADNGGYPATLNNCSSGKAMGNTGCTIIYMSNIPLDPTTKALYFYVPTGSPATSYKLVACLENNKDIQQDPSTDTLCTGGTASYSVFNP